VLIKNPAAVPAISYFGIRNGHKARQEIRPRTPAAFGILTYFVPESELTAGMATMLAHALKIKICSVKLALVYSEPKRSCKIFLLRKIVIPPKNSIIIVSYFVD